MVERLRLYSEQKDARRPIFVEDGVLTTQTWGEFESSGVIPLRRQSDVESGRVKWYRKLAREGRLPPVFLYYHVGLISWLVVDGHDRLLAAREEAITPGFVGVSSVRRRGDTFPVDHREELEKVLARALEKSPDQRTVDGVNKRLIALYEDDDWAPSTRGTVLDGGVDGWLLDVKRMGLPLDIFGTEDGL